MIEIARVFDLTFRSIFDFKHFMNLIEKFVIFQSKNLNKCFIMQCIFFSMFINFTSRMLTHICNWSKSFILNNVNSLLTRFERIFLNSSRIHTWFQQQFFIFFRQIDEQRIVSSFNSFVFSSFWLCWTQHLTKTCIRTNKSFIHEEFFFCRLISVTLYFAHFFFFF